MILPDDNYNNQAEGNKTLDALHAFDRVLRVKRSKLLHDIFMVNTIHTTGFAITVRLGLMGFCMLLSGKERRKWKRGEM